MRAASVLACIAIMMVSYVMATPLVQMDVAELNEHDEVVAIRQEMLPEYILSASLASQSVAATGTPDAISSAIAKIFNGAPTIHWKFPVFTRSATLKPYCGCNVNVIYNVHDRQPTAFHDPCKLPVGNFTFIATTDNQLTFGAPKNCLEWGTKHVHMANMRPGYGAGEITVRVDEATGMKTIRWNTKSGCFSKMLIDQQGAEYGPKLAGLLKDMWASASCAADFVFQTAPLLVESAPPVEEIEGICQKLGKHHYNNLLWTGCDRPLAKYLENTTLCQDYWHLPKCLPFEQPSHTVRQSLFDGAADTPLTAAAATNDDEDDGPLLNPPAAFLAGIGASAIFVAGYALFKFYAKDRISDVRMPAGGYQREDDF